MGVLTRSKKQEKKSSPQKSAFLKVVRPGGQVEIFRDPVPAREIMRRYPRHCITRPDFFEYPWIVVRPDSVLVPGKVFFLVPLHTVDKVMKDKMQQSQQSLNQDRHHRRSTTDHGDHHHRSNQHEDRYRRRHAANYDHNHNSVVDDQDFDNGGFYKELFYESWEEMRRRLEQLHQESQDSPLESGRPTVTSRELLVLQRAKPCLRKPGSGQEKLKLKVSFSSPIVVPGSQRGTPVHQAEESG
ncbi:hypothetical protein C2S51_023417 [Perilla frutescens var. frutescens]|nr:hypothetical protein C2S51_023417 [Perilla frutescens var. frutescens]